MNLARAWIWTLWCRVWPVHLNQFKAWPCLHKVHYTNDDNHLISWHCQIGCYDWDEDDNNDLIGCVDLTLRQLIDAKESGVCTYVLMFFLWPFCVWLWQIDCFDYDDDGSHDFIGSNSATLRQLLQTKQTGVRWQC